MASTDEGGDAACWAHLVEPPISDIDDRVDVERFVRDFYRQAAMDDVLGPVFAAAGMNWNAHIETLVEFWSWQLFGERSVAELAKARANKMATAMRRLLAGVSDVGDTPVDATWVGGGER
jgi:truncated hemoglobin YjbI